MRELTTNMIFASNLSGGRRVARVLQRQRLAVRSSKVVVERRRWGGRRRRRVAMWPEVKKKERCRRGWDSRGAAACAG